MMDVLGVLRPIRISTRTFDTAPAETRPIYQTTRREVQPNPAKTTVSACDRVFGILELAETIFLELPPQQILVTVQRVCRKWHEIVAASIPLQQALFFRPITKTGPLRFFASPGSVHGGNWCASDGKSSPKQIFEHPLVGRLLLYEERLSEAAARPEASWRRQLLTQPCVQAVSVKIGPAIVELEAGPGGVKMGHVWKVTQLCPPGSLSISNWSMWKGYLREWRDSCAREALATVEAVDTRACS